MKILHTELMSVLQFRIISVRHINYILVRIFTNHKPRSATQAQAFTLTDSMKPITAMRTQYLSRFQLNNPAFLFSEETTDKVIIINPSQETDSLTVSSSGTGQLSFQSNIAHFLFHQSAQREHQFGHLQVVYLRKKVRLVFYGVEGCSQPGLSILQNGSSIMSGCRKVEVPADLLFKATEFNQLVAHHIRIRSEPAANFFNSISGYIIPVLPM